MTDLAGRFTSIIVTRNMQQPARICRRTAFFTVEADAYRIGKLVEVDTAEHIFSNPSDARIEAYLTGRFG